METNKKQVNNKFKVDLIENPNNLMPKKGLTIKQLQDFWTYKAFLNEPEIFKTYEFKNPKVKSDLNKLIQKGKTYADTTDRA